MRKFPKRNIFIPKGELISIISLIFQPSMKKLPHVKDFEAAFKKYVNAKEAIAISSGRSALNLILNSCSVAKGSEVLLSAYNFVGVPEALIQDGYSPVFIDADANTYQMDITDLESKITPKTRAIIVTHLFGQLTDIEAVKSIAKKHNFLVIEDAAQALGSSYKDQHAGTVSEIGFFSFTGSKPLNTSYGGMIVTNDPEMGARIREALNKYTETSSSKAFFCRLKTYLHALAINKTFYSFIVYPITIFFSKLKIDIFECYKGLDKSLTHHTINKLNYLQGFIGSNQIDQIISLIEERRELGKKLISKLDPSISMQHTLYSSRPCYFMIPLKTKNKPKAYKELLALGIDSNLSYAQDCSFLTNSENRSSKKLENKILTINLPFDLKDEEITYIADSINRLKGLFE